MTRLTLLFLIAALAVPGAALAADRNAAATEAYYSSYGEPTPITASAPAAETSGHTGPSWFGAVGIGVGLILVAGGLGIYAGRSVRPRHLGA